MGLGWVFDQSHAKDFDSLKRFGSSGHYSKFSNFSARGVSVNVHCNLQIDEQSSALVSQSPNVSHAGPRIERCEFEQLLQRAMEILNARRLKAQLKTTP
jgi:hypothetical protein